MPIRAPDTEHARWQHQPALRWLPVLLLVACGEAAEQAPVPIVRADPPVVAADLGVATITLSNLGGRGVVATGIDDPTGRIDFGPGAADTRVEAAADATLSVTVEDSSAGLAWITFDVDGLVLPPASNNAEPEPAFVTAGVIVASIPDIEPNEEPAILVEQVDTFSTPDARARAAVFVYGETGLSCERVRGTNGTPIPLTLLPSAQGEAAWGTTPLPDEAVAEVVVVECTDRDGDVASRSAAVTVQGAPYLANVAE